MNNICPKVIIKIILLNIRIMICQLIFHLSEQNSVKIHRKVLGYMINTHVQYVKWSGYLL